MSKINQVLEAVKSSPQGVTAQWVIEKTGIKEPTVRTSLWRLVQSGALQQNEMNLYEVPKMPYVQETAHSMLDPDEPMSEDEIVLPFPMDELLRIAMQGMRTPMQDEPIYYWNDPQGRPIVVMSLSVHMAQPSDMGGLSSRPGTSSEE